MLQQDLSLISYDGIKQNLIDFISSNPRFSDINFGGSNISYLVDMLAYSAYFTNVYNSFALNESFLDTATLRENVVANAKSKGYIPSSRTSATMTIGITLDTASIIADGLALPEQVTVPINSIFSVKLLDKLMTFSTLKSYTIYNSFGDLSLSNIVLYEGVQRELNIPFNEQSAIVMPLNCDTKTIRVSIDGISWEYAIDGILHAAESKVYYLRENSNGLFEIYFGDGVVSARPNNNATVSITYLESIGPNANAGVAPVNISYSSTFISNNINYTKYISINVVSTPSGGANRESIEDIRKNTLYNTVTQKRATTVKDYAYILESIFYNTVLHANSWDLNDDASFDFTRLGHVYMCVQPREYRTSPYLQQDVKNQILKSISINYIVGGIRPVLLDPIYLKVNHNITIFYDKDKLDSDMGVIKSNIVANIKALYDSEIIRFNTYLPISRIQSTVDSSDRSIVSSSVVFSVTMDTQYLGDPLSKIVNIGNQINANSIVFSSNCGTVTKTVVGDIVTCGSTVYGNDFCVIDCLRGTVTYSIISYPLNNGVISLTFTTVSPFIKTNNELLLIDSDTYSWIETPVN
jgi:hypothetical protein